ncbi:MAG: metallophosphoesterase [Terracidiphilus sp.]
MKAWPLFGIALIQTLLLAAHWFIYCTWIAFWQTLSPRAALLLGAALLLLAFSFVPAALLGFFYANRLVTLLYRLAAVWLGFLNYFFWAACLSWLTSYALTALQLHVDKPFIAAAFYSMAVAAGIYGLVNARILRIRRVSIQLPGLPDAWRGRTALVLSDLHLGHMNGRGFSRRIVALAMRLNPEIIFFPGDLFDGIRANSAALIEPFSRLAPPLGSYFSTGNHDEFGNAARCAELLSGVGIRALSNEMVTIDGLQIAGVSYGDSGSPIRLRAILESLHLDPGKASILLNHVPSRLPIVEQAGISLQISGHTHSGQLFPFTFFTRRAFGNFTYGLQRFGGLQVYTSSGAGSWGPPMRLGTCPEVVLFTFE